MRILMTAAAALLLSPLTAQAATLYVDDSSACRPPGAGTLSCPFHTIQDALAVAQANDLVDVAAGLYSDAISIPNGVSLQGEGPSTTIIDFSQGGRIDAPSPGGSLSISGFTIRGADWPTQGGALWKFFGTVDVADCVFEDNEAGGGGGAISVANVALTLTGVTFRNNRASAAGGAVEMAGSSDVTIEDCLFESNNSADGAAVTVKQYAELTIRSTLFKENIANAKGGAIFTAGSPPVTIIDSTFVANTAKDQGGAIWNDGDMIVRGSTFVGNVGDVEGGGIYSEASLSIRNTEIKDSTSQDGGGISSHGPLTLEDVTLVDNTATGGGGALYQRNEPASIVRSVIRGNSAQYGGAIMNEDTGFGTIYNTLIVDNSGYVCSGIYNFDGSSTWLVASTIADNSAIYSGRAACAGNNSAVYLTNSIVWDQAQEFWVDSTSVVSASYSDIFQTSGVFPGSWNVNASPGFAADYTPGQGTAVVDAGTNSLVPSPFIDVYGNPRLVDGDGNGSATIDMGAVERQ